MVLRAIWACCAGQTAGMVAVPVALHGKCCQVFRDVSTGVRAAVWRILWMVKAGWCRLNSFESAAGLIARLPGPDSCFDQDSGSVRLAFSDAV